MNVAPAADYAACKVTTGGRSDRCGTAPTGDVDENGPGSVDPGDDEPGDDEPGDDDGPGDDGGEPDDDQDSNDPPPCTPALILSGQSCSGGVTGDPLIDPDLEPDPKPETPDDKPDEDPDEPTECEQPQLKGIVLQAKATSTVLTPSRNCDPEDPFADPPEDPFRDPPGEDLFDHDPSVESSEDEPDRPDREGEELTDQEKIDLFIYTTSEYLRINRALRSGQPLSEEMQRRVDSISDALSKLPRMTGTIPGETEVLFDRNTSFEVVSSTTDPVTGKTLIKLKEVPGP